MADQKRWFKVWTSIVANAHFAEMSLEDIGRWTLLGAATALDGDRGHLPVPGEGRELCRLLRVDALSDAQKVLERLRSVSFSVCNEEGKKRYGEHSVTWANWNKYQEDTTAGVRMKTLRSKRRGEEKRREETRASLGDPPANVTASASNSHPDTLPDSITAALTKAKRLGAVARLQTWDYWQAEMRASRGELDYAAEILKAEAWLAANPRRAPKTLPRFMHNWLARAFESAV